MMLSNRTDLRKIREIYSKALKSQKRKILVCCGTGCLAGGSMDIHYRLKELIEEKGLKCTVELEKEPHGDSIGLKKSGCHGFCEMGPLVRIEPEGILYTKVKLSDCEEIVEKTIMENEIVERLVYKVEGKPYVKQEDIPFYAKQTRVVLEHCGHIDATSIEEYFGIGGYSGLEKALFEITPEDIIDTITESSLRGRGGGGFPTGKKWAQVKNNDADEKYIVCNGDEGDPGAFMDRSIMEGDPHRMIEGMIIAGIATGSEHGYIYVRAEYPMAVNRLENAIKQAKEYGLIGENILGSGFNFDFHINKGAGAFVCGEGSALTASIEGKRGMPRVKPPRTVEQGLFGKPTVLNNVETFANVPNIINKGAQWYKGVGSEKSPGTKAFALTGNIENTGLIEVPMGATLREIIFDIGGGMKNGKKFKAVQIGGPSGGCIPEQYLDTPIDYESLSAIGSMMGSGGLIIMDDTTCMVNLARFFLDFTVDESCGKCPPCRIGTKRMLEILERLVAGKGKDGDIEKLEKLALNIKRSSLCGLGQTAPNPVLSTLKYFRNEYEAHIYEKRCPAGECKAMTKVMIDKTKCKGCSLCSKNCPVGAITGELKSPFEINQDKCIKCGVCIAKCPFKAISRV